MSEAAPPWAFWTLESALGNRSQGGAGAGSGSLARAPNLSKCRQCCPRYADMCQQVVPVFQYSYKRRPSSQKDALEDTFVLYRRNTYVTVIVVRLTFYAFPLAQQHLAMSHLEAESPLDVEQASTLVLCFTVPRLGSQLYRGERGLPSLLGTIGPDWDAFIQVTSRLCAVLTRLVAVGAKCIRPMPREDNGLRGPTSLYEVQRTFTFLIRKKHCLIQNKTHAPSCMYCTHS